MRGVVWLIVLVGCGRIAFDPRTTGDGGPGDAPGIDGTFSGQQVTYIKAPNTDVDDFFGSAVAVSADGNTVVIGAPGEDGAATMVDGNQASNGAGDAGAAYVLVRAGSTWSYQGYLKASNAEGGDRFGQRVAISGDGTTIAVAAPAEDSITGVEPDNGGNGVGAVYVFARAGSVWQQQGYIKAPNPDSFDDFGSAIALSSDGNELLVGADGEASALTGVNPANFSNNTEAGAGAAYAYARGSSGTWALDDYLKASNTDGSDLFGTAVAISGDGNTIAIGAIQESSSNAGIGGDQNDNSLGNSGAVYVLVRNGASWLQQTYIKASNPIGGGNFGFSLSLSATGDTLVVGARGESSAATGVGGSQVNGGAFASGASYVFERAGTTWAQTSYVKSTNTDAGDEFGRTLAMSANAQILAVAAEYEASGTGLPVDNSQPSAGAVYVFGRTAATWEPRAYLKSPGPEGGDNLGASAAISGDGSVLAIGAPGEDGSGTGVGASPDEASSDSGAMFLIE